MKVNLQQLKEHPHILLPLEDEYEIDPETCFIQYVANIEAD